MSHFIKGVWLALLLGIIWPVFGQQYTTTGGLRVGRSIGLTVNQRIARKVTIEGILQTNLTGSTTLHGLIRQHQSLMTRRLSVYYGAGAHTGSTTGIDAILGVETTFAKINMSIDVKPVVNVLGVTGFNVFQVQAGASIRYVLIKSGDTKKQRERKKKRKQRQRAKRKQQKNRN